MRGTLGITGHNRAGHGGHIVDGMSGNGKRIRIFPELAVERSIGTEHKSIRRPRLIPTSYLPGIDGLTGTTRNGAT